MTTWGAGCGGGFGLCVARRGFDVGHGGPTLRVGSRGSALRLGPEAGLAYGAGAIRRAAGLSKIRSGAGPVGALEGSAVVCRPRPRVCPAGGVPRMAGAGPADPNPAAWSRAVQRGEEGTKARRHEGVVSPRDVVLLHVRGCRLSGLPQASPRESWGYVSRLSVAALLGNDKVELGGCWWVRACGGVRRI